MIDGRPARQYDLAHIPGTIGIDAAVNGFGTKAAWIAEPGAELVLVAADEPAALHMQGLLDVGRPVRRRHAGRADSPPGRRPGSASSGSR